MGNKTILNIVFLYLGKAGPVIVGIFILPWYQQLLSIEDFGKVALVISIQSFLILIDFGMSTLIGRDLAYSENKKLDNFKLNAAKILLHFFYIMLLMIALFIQSLLNYNLGYDELIASILFFWFQTLNNLDYQGMLSKRLYLEATLLQATGLILRSTLTIVVLMRVDDSFNSFIITQMCASLIQTLNGAWFWKKYLKKINLNIVLLIKMAYKLLKRGRPLILIGLSGALVLQMDKVIVATFTSPAELAPYFLASILCLTPISILAAPINQFFLPRVQKSIGRFNEAEAIKNINVFTCILIISISIPSILIWINSSTIINIWLGDISDLNIIQKYFSILLPGVAIGALGFIPNSLLNAIQDYNAQSKLSMFMTCLTLIFVMYFSLNNNITGVCITYTFYHTFMTLFQWIRAILLKNKIVSTCAKKSGKRVVYSLVIIFLITYFLK